MKKSILIGITLFLVTAVLQMVLKIVVNEQIISRILFGVDYTTYMTEQLNFIDLLSNSAMPYEWVFNCSNYIITLLCIAVMFIVIKKLSKKNKISKKEFITIGIIFALLSFYEVIMYLVLYHLLPNLKMFINPLIYIVLAIIGLYKFMYKNK